MLTMIAVALASGAGRTSTCRGSRTRRSRRARAPRRPRRSPHTSCSLVRCTMSLRTLLARGHVCARARRGARGRSKRACVGKMSRTAEGRGVGAKMSVSSRARRKVVAGLRPALDARLRSSASRGTPFLPDAGVSFMDSVCVRFQFCARARREVRSQNDTSAASHHDARFRSSADAR